MVLSFFGAWRTAKKNKEYKMALLEKEDQVLNRRHSIQRQVVNDDDDCDQHTPLLSGKIVKNTSIN